MHKVGELYSKLPQTMFDEVVSMYKTLFANYTSQSDVTSLLMEPYFVTPTILHAISSNRTNGS